MYLRALPIAVVLAALPALADPAAEPASPAPAVPPASAPPARPFRCDGTDPFFFAELEKAGTVGYGETWDATVCDEGVAVYAEGATSRWSPFKRTRRPATKDEQALALVLPLTLGGGLALIVGSAGVLALVGRLRRRRVLEAPCPACGAPLPVDTSEGDAQLFCPMCGGACAIHIVGRGQDARAHASPLA